MMAFSPIVLMFEAALSDSGTGLDEQSGRLFRSVAVFADCLGRRKSRHAEFVITGRVDADHAHA
jgi:hypothetical protein